MNTDELSGQVFQNGKDISALKESLKSAHKRIDENDRITEGIHKLASNVEALALQVKLLTDSVDNSLEHLESGLRHQGERIGLLEKEPGAKWKTLVSQVIAIAVAAVIGAAIAKLTT